MTLGSLGLAPSGILRFFTQNRQIDGWQETASDWVTVGLVAALFVAIVAVVAKSLYEKKVRSTGDSGRLAYEGPSRSRLILVVFFFVVTGVVVFLWGIDRDFREIVGTSGLAKSVLAAWLVFLGSLLTGFAIFHRHHMPWK